MSKLFKGAKKFFVHFASCPIVTVTKSPLYLGLLSEILLNLLGMSMIVKCDGLTLIVRYVLGLLTMFKTQNTCLNVMSITLELTICNTILFNTLRTTNKIDSFLKLTISFSPGGLSYRFTPLIATDSYYGNEIRCPWNQTRDLCSRLTKVSIEHGYAMIGCDCDGKVICISLIQPYQV